jgi:asparagine synthase (glutamine-hydrolysing)
VVERKYWLNNRLALPAAATTGAESHDVSLGLLKWTSNPGSIRAVKGPAMNLFVAARHLDPAIARDLPDAVASMTRVYPQLDPETLQRCSFGNTTVVSMTHAPALLGARRYLWASRSHATIYDGTIVLPAPLSGADAATLHQYWSRLADAEGQFVAIHATAETLDVFVDPFGMEQVYRFERGRTVLLSNNVAILAAITGSHTLDPVGAALFLSWGWVGRDRTLNEGIRVLPGGRSKWTDHGHTHIPSTIRCERRPVKIGALADELVRLLQSLPPSTIRLGLTAGKDSRLIAALVLHAGIRVLFTTSGDLNSSDVRAAVAIAERFHLEHRAHAKTVSPEPWEVLQQRLIAHSDGMVSLWQIADVIDQPSRIDGLRMGLPGWGGEIARGFYTHPKLFLRPRFTHAYLRQRFGGDHGGLLTADARGLALRELDAFITEHPGDPLDLPDHFYTEERVRRWAGANGRNRRAVADYFAVFITRPFVEAAFARPPRRRIAESLHYDLLRHLNPELHAFPLTKPWRPQRFTVPRLLAHRVLSRMRAPVRHRSPMADAVTERDQRLYPLMAKALEQSSSTLWTLISRPHFERAMRHPAQVRSTLWDAITLFAYAELQHSTHRPDKRAPSLI